LANPGPAADPGIEAAFLQMFKAWEFFLEESVVAYLCGRLCLDGASVASHITAPSEEIARRLLGGDRGYAEWTNVDDVQSRLGRYFPLPNRIDNALKASMVDLRHIARIRNSIAHTSTLASRRFRELAEGLLGGRPSIKRPAQLLVTSYPGGDGLLFFERYADVLEATAQAITG
jgi:hypothetical protein